MPPCWHLLENRDIKYSLLLREPYCLLDVCNRVVQRPLALREKKLGIFQSWDEGCLQLCWVFYGRKTSCLLSKAGQMSSLEGPSVSTGSGLECRINSESLNNEELHSCVTVKPIKGVQQALFSDTGKICVVSGERLSKSVSVTQTRRLNTALREHGHVQFPTAVLLGGSMAWSNETVGAVVRPPCRLHLWRGQPRTSVWTSCLGDRNAIFMLLCSIHACCRGALICLGKRKESAFTGIDKSTKSQ